VKWLQSNWLSVALAAALLASGLYVMRGCRLGDDYAKFKKGYEEARKVAEADHAIQVQFIAAKEAENAALLDKNKALEGTIAANQHAMLAKDDDIHKLEGELAVIEAGGDKDAAIRNLKAQVAAWAAKFSLCMANTNAKDEQIANLSAALNNQAQISESWKSQYEKEHALRLLAEGLFTNLEHRIKVSSFWSRAKTVALVAVGGGLVYSLVKK